MERPDPPSQLQELAHERSYWIQYDAQKDEWAWWLTLGQHPETLKPQLEKCGLRPFSPFTPDYIPHVFERRGEYFYHPHYPPLYLGSAKMVLGVEVEEYVDQRREMHKEALSYYTDGGPNWRVQREHLSDLTAERDDLEQQIEREGERLGMLLQTAMSILEVLYSEYIRAAPEQKEPSADGRPSQLVIDIMSVRTALIQQPRNWVRQSYEAVSSHLREAGVADFLISCQWTGIEDILDARDVILGPVFYMDQKRVICEKLLDAARLDKRAPRWREMREELQQRVRRDTSKADRKLRSAKSSVAVTLLAPAENESEHDFTVAPEWKKKSEKALFKEAKKKDKKYQREGPAIKRQITDNMEDPPGGRGASKWEPHAQEWVRELKIAPLIRGKRKT